MIRGKIRPVTADDSAEILAIYAHYVIHTYFTFETDVPTEAAFRARIQKIAAAYPYLVYEEDGRIVGYAYASQYRERAAYCYDAELSIYLHHDSSVQNRGIGRALYTQLLDALKSRGYYHVYAGITLPNDQSLRFHTRMGFTPVGTYRQTGYKLGKWWDVHWLEKHLRECDTVPGGIHDSYRLTEQQARRFLLQKHGLRGAYRFRGKQGILDYVAQAGCIQYDPIDVCGRNAELVLQSRVEGFQKAQLAALLYEDRKLVDYFDKNLSILPTGDWPYMARYRKAHAQSGRSRDEVNRVAEEIKNCIQQNGPMSSADFRMDEKVSWYWNDTKLSRAALETLYFRGELVVHHKKNAVKYYDLAENCIPAAILQQADPYPDAFEHTKFRVIRRIGAVGLLWNKPSDAWLGIPDLKSTMRSEIFSALLAEGRIREITVEGFRDKFYCLFSDTDLLVQTINEPLDEPANSVCGNPCRRAELLAPLDNLLWDRKLIDALFHFQYKWEIYTPVSQRQFGYYVLPLLYRDQFVGRIEAVRDKQRQALHIHNIWYEPQVTEADKTAMKESLHACLRRFSVFNGFDEHYTGV